MERHATSFAHLILFFVSIVISSILREYGNGVANFFGLLKKCINSGEPMCFGNEIVYRMSFSLFVFFSLTTILSWATGQQQSGWWCLKLPIFMILVVVTYFIPNRFFNVYVEFSRFASAIFIIIQIIVVIDFAYGCQEYLLKKIEEVTDEISNYQSRRLLFWRGIYLISSIGGLVVCFIACGLMYSDYSCDIATNFITITLISCIVMSAFSVCGPVAVGLLPASVMSLCITFGCWQALNSMTDPQCKPKNLVISNPSDKTILPTVALAAFSLTWTCWRISSALPTAFSMGSDSFVKEDEQRSILLRDNDGVAPSEKCLNDDSYHNGYWQFYAIMSLASCYMAMAQTAWGSVDSEQTASFNSTSVWFKIVPQWITIAIYLWTLVAPIILKNRDFSYEM